MAQIIKIETVKRLAGSIAGSDWRNTYHYELTAPMIAGDAGGVGISSTLFTEAVTAILQGETNLHAPSVIIERAVCTTPEEDDNDEPQHLRVIAWGRTGLRAGAPDDRMLPLETVVKVAFAGATGRSGANQYRGVLYQGDVTLEGGGYKLKVNIGQQILDGLMQPMNAKQVPAQMRIVKVKAGIVTSRLVASINILGISNRQRTQKKRSKHPTTPAAVERRLRNAVNDISAVQAVLNAWQVAGFVTPAVPNSYALLARLIESIRLPLADPPAP